MYFCSGAFRSVNIPWNNFCLTVFCICLLWNTLVLWMEMQWTQLQNTWPFLNSSKGRWRGTYGELRSWLRKKSPYWHPHLTWGCLKSKQSGEKLFSSSVDPPSGGTSSRVFTETLQVEAGLQVRLSSGAAMNQCVGRPRTRRLVIDALPSHILKSLGSGRCKSQSTAVFRLNI